MSTRRCAHRVCEPRCTSLNTCIFKYRHFLTFKLSNLRIASSRSTGAHGAARRPAVGRRDTRGAGPRGASQQSRQLRVPWWAGAQQMTVEFGSDEGAAAGARRDGRWHPNVSQYTISLPTTTPRPRPGARRRTSSARSGPTNSRRAIWLGSPAACATTASQSSRGCWSRPRWPPCARACLHCSTRTAMPRPRSHERYTPLSSTPPRPPSCCATSASWRSTVRYAARTRAAG